MDSGCELLNRGWHDRLNGYMRHRNDEHLEALVHEARDYYRKRIEPLLPRDSLWHTCDDSLRAGALLYLLDCSIVERCLCERAVPVYKPAEAAEYMILARPDLLPVAMPLLELVACIRLDRSRTSDPNATGPC